MPPNWRTEADIGPADAGWRRRQQTCGNDHGDDRRPWSRKAVSNVIRIHNSDY